MKKRLCYRMALMLLGVLLLSSTVTVYADTTDSVTVSASSSSFDSDYDALSKTPEKLPNGILFGELNFMKRDGKKGLSLQFSDELIFNAYKFESPNDYAIHIKNDGNYKYIIYSDSDKMFYFNKDLELATETGLYGSYLYRTGTLGIKEVLELSCAMPEDSRYNFATNPSNVNTLAEWNTSEQLKKCYVLVFPSDATSVNELKYKIPFTKLADYVDWTTRDTKVESSRGTINSLEVKTDEPIVSADATTGYNIKIKYNMTAFDESHPIKPSSISIFDAEGYAIETKILSADYNEPVGEIILPLNYLVNDTYKYIFYTTTGLVKEGTFEVKGITELPEENDEPYDDTVPTVTFKGIPESAYIGDEIALTLSIDVPCKVVFNGITVDNNEYNTECKVSVFENGVYSYTVISKSGVEYSDVLEVEFFTDRPADADAPIKLVQTEETKLTQTGIEDKGYWFVGGGFMLVGICLVGGLLLKRKKGENK